MKILRLNDIVSRSCIIHPSMGFTYPIPDRWRMCTISYSIPRWRTAISWGVSVEARIWYTTPECIDKRSKNLLDWKVHITLKTQAYDLCSLLSILLYLLNVQVAPTENKTSLKLWWRISLNVLSWQDSDKTRRICHIYAIHYNWKRRFWS